MPETKIYPDGWNERLHRTLDLEAAFDDLRGYEHFHSFTLKGMLRHLQVRGDEAIAHFDEAEARFTRVADSPANTRRFSFLLELRLEARLLQEAVSRSAEAMERTDYELARLVDWDGAYTAEARRIREKGVAFYHLVRGNYQEALEFWEGLIARSPRNPERCLTAYILASAASHELGLFKESRRHYENAELTMAFCGDRLGFSVFVTWLRALSLHWGWEREAARWTETIRVLDCPEDTRACLFRRARVLEQATKRGSLMLA